MESQDIKEYLQNIKKSIKKVESGNHSVSLFENIENDYCKMLELIKLFMITERDSYYGYFMMNMTFRTDFQSSCIAGIRLDTYPPVMESNPLLLCNYSLKEIIFIICHEVEHIILRHPAEMLKTNPAGDPEVFERFNLAADASVNDRLDYEINTENRTFMTIPEDCITSQTLKKMFRLKKVRPLENYKYYYDLIKNKNMPEKNKNDSSSAENRSNTKSHISADEIITAQNCGEIIDHKWKAGDDADAVSAIIREFINETVKIMDDETRSLMPRFFLEQVEIINQPPKISWQKLLKKYVGTISGGKRKTRTRLNRRQPERFDISGEMNDKIIKIVVAIDTSGSVSSKEISMIFCELFSIVSKRKYCITVIECDSQIQRIYSVRNPSDVKTDVAGRGGTLFTPVIEYVNSDRYFRDALLIYFTDGYGESIIPKPLTYRNLWVITGNKNELSLENPYGTVISFEEGE